MFTIATSSAASEQSWSAHSFIHSKHRNRLTTNRVRHLVFVYSNCRANRGVKSVDFAQFDLCVENQGGGESEGDGDIFECGEVVVANEDGKEDYGSDDDDEGVEGVINSDCESLAAL